MNTYSEMNQLASTTSANDEWDTSMLVEEEPSNTNLEGSDKIFDQWKSEACSVEEELDIMEVDEQIGSNLLGEDIFPDPCMSPTGPLEEIVLMNLEEQDLDRFSLSFLEDNDTLPFEERYKATLSKLAESMRRSQETRKSLQMTTSHTKDYSRNSSVSGVISSIEKSSQQLQGYLKSIRSV